MASQNETSTSANVSSSPPTLSSSQLSSLFDILTHYDTYAEIRDFRHPKSLDHYGPPFTHEKSKPSTSPALQTLVSRFLLNLPGLKDLPEEFWTTQLHSIISALEDADLSESYDKSVIGSRKTLSTAISALIEYPVRGTFGGFANVRSSENDRGHYDVHDAKELGRAFRDFLDQSIYGGILAEMVKKTGETDRLEDHGALTQGVHEFVLVNLASFMHYALILSPKGQYLVKLIDNINKLIPYMVVRQTLKIGNVASMINAMVKVGLAKMSMASITNWMGITQTEDEGMNLMQQIISTVLSWDNKDLESRAAKIEKDKNGPSKEILTALKAYQDKSREDHEMIRKQSQQESISIVAAILNASAIPSDISAAHHKIALDYLSIVLSIRDRKEIIRILCHSTPDHLTTSVRALVAAYEPVIRQMHNAIDLADTVYDFELFIRDMLKLAKVQAPPPTSAVTGGREGKSVVPTVGDFVQLLKKHQYSTHKFMHQCCKNGKELTGWYLEWAQKAASNFKRKEEGGESKPGKDDVERQSGAGDMSDELTKLFNALDEKTQKKIIPILDAQTKYLDEIHAASAARLESVLRSPPSKNPAISKILLSPTSTSRPSSRPASRPTSRASSPDRKTTNNANANSKEKVEPTSVTRSNVPPPTIDGDPGPGAYLARWQDLLDNTPITPLTVSGPVKKASSKEVIEKSSLDVDGEKMAQFVTTTTSSSAAAAGGKEQEILPMEKVKNKVEVGVDDDDDDDENRRNGNGGKKTMKKPNVRIVVDALGTDFRKVIAERSVYW